MRPLTVSGVSGVYRCFTVPFRTVGGEHRCALINDNFFEKLLSCTFKLACDISASKVRCSLAHAYPLQPRWLSVTNLATPACREAQIQHSLGLFIMLREQMLPLLSGA